MTKFTRCFSGVSLVILTTTYGFSQTIPFDSDRWEIRADEHQLVDYLGSKSLLMKGGMAIIKDSDFKNGTIEFDIAFTGERGFMGAVWRIYDPNNFEEFYLRPHQSGNPDANQYTPIFYGASGWQLYHGDGYGAPVDYLFNEWMHVKIVISGSRGEVYIKDMEEPVVTIHELKHQIKSGNVGLMCANFAPAHFANFSFRPMENPRLKSEPKHPEPTANGTITEWSVSDVFDEKSLEGKIRLSSPAREKLTWKRLACESSGLANLSRVQGISQNKNTAFARVTIESDKNQVRKLKFGYSDRIKVYVNDILLYSGNNNYRSRDYRYLGTIGYFDEVFLPLKKGKNELWLAVSEDFGGWGIKAAFDDMNGIKLE